MVHKMISPRSKFKLPKTYVFLHKPSSRLIVGYWSLALKQWLIDCGKESVNHKSDNEFARLGEL